MTNRILRVARLCLPLGALLLLPMLVVAPAATQEMLTVEDVLRLHAAGLSDDIIASEILVTGTIFYLSPDDLLRLKSAGLSDELIRFMVETALPPEDGEDDLDADAEELDDEDDGAYASVEWENEISYDSPPTYFVTLDYDYPSWWYVSYWDDYWYYGWHCPPYVYSYNWYFGGWYPGWYSYRYCYLPSYWGYRSSCYAGWGWTWNYQTCGTYYFPTGATYTPDVRHTHALSRTKYKTGSSSGKLLYAHSGLKTRDPGRHLATLTRAGKAPRERTRETVRLAGGKNIGADRIHRPIKTSNRLGHFDRTLTRGNPVRGDGKAPVLDSGRKRVTKRRPVLDKAPRGRSVRTVDEPPTPTRTPDRSKVDKPRVKDRRKPQAVSQPSRQNSPPKEESRTESRRVKTAPKAKEAPKAKPRVEEKKTDPAPPPKAAPRPAPPPERKQAPPPKQRDNRSKSRGKGRSR